MDSYSTWFLVCHGSLFDIYLSISIDYTFVGGTSLPSHGLSTDNENLLGRF